VVILRSEIEKIEDFEQLLELELIGACERFEAPRDFFLPL
jgi:hypothetical protein